MSWKNEIWKDKTFEDRFGEEKSQEIRKKVKMTWKIKKQNGWKHPCTGKPLSEEHKRNLKQNHVHTSTEWKKDHIPWNYGLTKETDARLLEQSINLSKRYKGVHISVRNEFKKGHVPCIKGKKHLEKTLKLISKNRSGIPSHKKGKTFEELYGKEKTELIKDKIRKGTRRKHTEKQNKIMSDIMKKKWESKEYRDSVIKNLPGQKGITFEQRYGLEKAKEKKEKAKKHWLEYYSKNKPWNYIDGTSMDYAWGLKINEYFKLRKQILDRDNFRCQRCGIEGKLHVHHIFPRHEKLGFGTINDEDNLLSLCLPCHRKIEKLTLSCLRHNENPLEYIWRWCYFPI